MILPYPQDALHKAMMYRLLISVLNRKDLASKLFFKGGTCAAMLGWLDRFSIDLDFDLKPGTDKTQVDNHLSAIFTRLNFAIDQQAKTELYYVLKYAAPAGTRNTLKLSLIDNPVKANIYQPYFLEEIRRFAVCQTIETMFANKLVALTDRYKKYHTIAGRDVYDIHHFFINGYNFNPQVILERTGKTSPEYFKDLVKFIDTKVTPKHILEDLNYLLPEDKFRAIRHTLITETLSFLSYPPAPSR